MLEHTLVDVVFLVVGGAAATAAAATLLVALALAAELGCETGKLVHGDIVVRSYEYRGITVECRESWC